MPLESFEEVFGVMSCVLDTEYVCSVQQGPQVWGYLGHAAYIVRHDPELRRGPLRDGERHWILQLIADVVAFPLGVRTAASEGRKFRRGEGGPGVGVDIPGPEPLGGSIVPLSLTIVHFSWLAQGIFPC